MVKRAETSGGLDEFVAVIKSAEFEESKDPNDDKRQYHLKLDPEGIEIKGATGCLHEWVPMSKTCTEEIVPPQSVMDRYLQQMEICIKEVEDAKSIADAFALLVGKKFKFKSMQLGRDYDKFKAKDYFVPVALVE